jgi:hypothetical protein
MYDYYHDFIKKNRNCDEAKPPPTEKLNIILINNNKNTIKIYYIQRCIIEF